MKSLVLFALLTLASAPPLVSQAPASGQLATGHPVGSVQLVIWNRAEQPIDIELRLGDDLVFAERVPEGSVATSIEAARVLQRQPGTYVLRVIDRTRNHEDSVTMEIDSRGQNVGVHLTPAGSAFVLTRGEVTAFTPLPSAPGSK